MTTNDLTALLTEAMNELAMLGSYADAPDTIWPNLGLKLTAKAQRALCLKIKAALDAGTPEEVELRLENQALRAALRVRDNNEHWRAKYLDSCRQVAALTQELNDLRPGEAS